MEINKFGSITLDEEGNLVLANFDFEFYEPGPIRELSADDYHKTIHCVLDFLTKKIHAIAPPVAAGSVDTPTWTSEAISCAYLPGAKQFVELEIHQQLVADALAGQEAVFRALIQKKDDDINMFVQRAEKAEAALVSARQIWKEYRETDDYLNAQLKGRVAELESELLEAHKSSNTWQISAVTAQAQLKEIEDWAGKYPSPYRAKYEMENPPAQPFDPFDITSAAPKAGLYSQK